MRLDQLLAARGLFASREQARRSIMASEIRVAGQVVDKPGAAVAEDAAAEVTARPPYVSRGGGKLAAALDAFAVDVSGRGCLDVGAWTGGSGIRLLQRATEHAYARHRGSARPRLWLHLFFER